MRSPWSGALATLFMAASFSSAQDTSQETSKSHATEVRFNDGSLVRMAILQDAIEVMTKYGKQTIPLSDVRRIDLGLHLPPGLEKKIEQSIRLLTSMSYKDREGATRDLLEAGHFAYPFLKKVSEDRSDAELANRVTGVMKRIVDKCAPELLRLKERDVIHTTDFPIIGRLVDPTIKAHSAHFGDITLKLSDVRTIHGRAGGGERAVTIDAAKHGSAPDQWLDTGATVDTTVRLLVTAEGQVDIWPQGPGQYVTTPKGYTTAGKGSPFMAGALVGRIGENGKQFLLGERYDGTPAEEGKLFIHVVPSPWNNASTGSYQVRITTSHAALNR